MRGGWGEGGNKMEGEWKLGGRRGEVYRRGEEGKEGGGGWAKMEGGVEVGR